MYVSLRTLLTAAAALCCCCCHLPVVQKTDELREMKKRLAELEAENRKSDNQHAHIAACIRMEKRLGERSAD